MQNVFIKIMGGMMTACQFKTALCICYLSSNDEYEKIIPRLHKAEYEYCAALKHKKRKKSYLLGRFTAKHAIAGLTGKSNLAGINIQSGVFNQPIAVTDAGNIQVSISHCDEFGAAVSFPEAYPMGIDIEKIIAGCSDALIEQFTSDERAQVNILGLSDEIGVTFLWTAKEALSKVLKTGLMTPLIFYEIHNIKKQNGLFSFSYRNFPQYQGISFIAGSYMCAITYPAGSKLLFPIEDVKKYFANIKIANSSNLK